MRNRNLVLLIFALFLALFNSCEKNQSKFPVLLLIIAKKWVKEYCDTICAPPKPEEIFKLEGFDNSKLPTYRSDLYYQCIDYYQKHDDKVIFIYGADDFWTGCGINDVWKDIRNDRQKYPTFDFDKKHNMAYYIVPNKGHSAIIAELPKLQQQEIWNKIDAWIKAARSKNSK